MGGAGDEEGVEPVDARLVHGVERGGPEGAQLLAAELDLAMPGPQRRRHAGGDRAFVGVRAALAPEAHGERRQVGVVPPRERCHQPGVEAGGEEHGDRDVGHQVRRDRVREGFGERHGAAARFVARRRR